MADNLKYYYIKLKDNYFDRDSVKLLEAQENGYVYSLIILKLYLKSARHNGQLMMTDRVPYSPDRVDVLAKVINHDVSHVKEAIRAAMELDLIAILETGEMWMTEIQNFIGQSSTEADRIREYRQKLQNGRKSLHFNDNSRTNVTPYKRTPEREIELEIKKETKTDCARDFSSQKPSEEFPDDDDPFAGFDPVPATRHDVASDDIDRIIAYANQTEAFPPERRLAVNIPNAGQVLDALSFYSKEEIRQALDNYAECIRAPDTYRGNAVQKPDQFYRE